MIRGLQKDSVVMLVDGMPHVEEIEEIHATRVILGLDEDDLRDALARARSAIG